MADFSQVGLNNITTGPGVIVLSWNPLTDTSTNGVLEPLEGFPATLVSVAVQRALFGITGPNDWTTLSTSTGQDFAGSTYTDSTAVGTSVFVYRLAVTVTNGATPESAQKERAGMDEGSGNPYPLPTGALPGAGAITVIRYSNWGYGSLLNTVTLTATVTNGNKVNLNWSVSGPVVQCQIYRTGGSVTRLIKSLSGHGIPHAYNELISEGSGPLSYYVVTTVGQPDLAHLTQVTSNTVTVSPVGVAQDTFGHS